MASEELRRLFVHELNLARNSEVAGNHMLADIAVHARSRELRRVLDEGAHSRHEQLENLDACAQAAGISSGRRVTEPVIEALRGRFQEFLGMQPSPDVLDMFVLGTSLRVTVLAIAAYDELIELAEILGQLACVRRLRMNLVSKEEYAYRLRRTGYDLGYQIVGDGALVARA